MLPNVVDINSQEDIVPLLQTEYGKIPVPKNVPIYLLSGEQVDESYIRPRGCTIDIVCDSFENGTFSNIEKIIVNRTIDQKVDQMPKTLQQVKHLLKIKYLQVSKLQS